MNKQLIVETLQDKHRELINWLENSEDRLWEIGPEDRWTTGQHVQHLLDSLKMLNKALMIPKFLLRVKYGTANRSIRSYDEVAKRYREKLVVSQEKAKTFNKGLKKPSLIEKYKLLKELKDQDNKLIKKLLKMDDKDLDKYLLPHPLMGRMIFREIIMWTAYHTEHHFEILKRDYCS